jgi:hypothetical protein
MATVALRVIGVPVAPAVKFTVVPVLLPLIVPLVIDHWYVEPPTLVIDALLPVAVVTAAGAVIVTGATVWTTTVTGSEVTAGQTCETTFT